MRASRTSLVKLASLFYPVLHTLDPDDGPSTRVGGEGQLIVMYKTSRQSSNYGTTLNPSSNYSVPSPMKVMHRKAATAPIIREYHTSLVPETEPH